MSHFVLLSAICVQKPLLAFQQAKLAFEDKLAKSGMRYSIMRPTAFFKSLSGQIERVRRGRPFLIFGDGALTTCKPIDDDDLASFIAGCLNDEARWNRVLPIGGPGPAITPREQGERLFALLERQPRFQSVPVSLLDLIVSALSRLGRMSPFLAEKGRTGADRALLRHRVYAGHGPSHRVLRRCGHSIDGHAHAVQLLCRCHRRRAGA